MVIFMINIPSPLALIMHRKFGPRKPVVLGVLLLAGSLVGFGASYHLAMLIAFYGIGVGTGASLSLLPPAFLLAEYFPYYHRYHVAATSIIFCGMPAGLYQSIPFIMKFKAVELFRNMLLNTIYR